MPSCADIEAKIRPEAVGHATMRFPKPDLHQNYAWFVVLAASVQ